MTTVAVESSYATDSKIHPKNKPVYDFFKRVLDIICSLLALIVLSPLMLVVMLAIVIEDGGSPIFTQIRVGRDRKLFKMYKFRSMHKNAEKELKYLQEQNEADGPAFKMENDPRVTKVGNLIRQCSIDELPQLINILRGDMSIVGPRPCLVREYKQYNDYQKQRILVKPGLTCYWQCSGRSNISFDEWMDMDMKYIQERGMWTDIKLVLKTIPAVVKRDGAC